MSSLVDPVPGARWLTTAQLSQETGVPPGTLRQWEARHGFPAPDRLGQGRHRYRPADVAAIQEVLQLRRQGLSMPAAIERVRDHRPPPPSIFAALRERRPELQPVLCAKRSLLALSRAIEDEHIAGGESGVLVGSFQRERFYRQSQARWIELARTAEVAVALADFPAYREPPRAPIEVPVDRDHPLAREWTVVVHSSGGAVVAGVELPAAGPVADRERRFEVLWSFDPEVVHEALRCAAMIVRALAPAAAAGLTSRLELGATSIGSSPPRFGSRLALRTIGYLAGENGRLS